MSVPADLIAAVQAKLGAALGSDWSVKPRKELVRAQGDPARLAVLAVGAGRRVPATGGDPAFGWFGSYPVGVALTWSHDRAGRLTLADDLLTVKAAAVTALTDLHGLGLLLPALDDLELADRPPFDPAALDAGVDRAGFTVTYRVQEPL